MVFSALKSEEGCKDEAKILRQKKAQHFFYFYWALLFQPPCRFWLILKVLLLLFFDCCGHSIKTKLKRSLRAFSIRYFIK